MWGLRHRVIAGLALFAVALTHEQWASAENLKPRTSSLSWIRLSGAEECVATQDLARDVEERLGRAVFVSAAQADVSVEGHIEPKPNGWHAAITIRDEKGSVLGTRELTRVAKSCLEMREPLALVIAVMIDPDAAMAPHAIPISTPAEPKVLIQKERVIVLVPQPPSPKPDAWRFDAGASLIANVGLLPNAGLGITVNGLLEPPHFIPLEVLGAIWFDNTAAASGGGQGIFSLGFLGAGLCPLRTHSDRVHAYLCGAGHLGLLKARGTGFDVSSPDQQQLYLAGAIDARLTIRLAGPISVRAGLSLVVPVLREMFVFRQPDGSQAELFQMAPAAGMADLGIGVVLP